MIYEIKNRWNGSLIFSLECGSLKLCVEAALKANTNLRGADLRGADLRGADLTGASLRSADLTGADLRDADLTGANLTGANLTGANLRDADLTGANLTDANLTRIRDDIWAVLSSSPAEVQGLRDALVAGKINGSTYEGECACLVGTLANVRHCAHDAIPGLTPNSDRPAEVWFYNIKPGHTPENSQVAAITLGWVDDWLERMRKAFAAPAVV